MTFFPITKNIEKNFLGKKTLRDPRQNNVCGHLHKKHYAKVLFFKRPAICFIIKIEQVHFKLIIF